MNQFHNLNLNDLRVLDLLLQTRHTTRTAERLGLTQSGVSHALARLRRHFDDDLLVRGRGGMTPTPLGESLGPALSRALLRLREVAEGEAGFEPATSRRVFTVTGMDYVDMVILPALVSETITEAPHLDFVARRQSLDFLEADLERGISDLAVGVFGNRFAGMNTKFLIEEHFVGLARKGHPALLDGTLTEKAYAELPHVLVGNLAIGPGAVDRALERIGKRRRVQVRVSSFAAAPQILEATNAVVTVPSRLVPIMTRMAELTPFQPPISVDGFKVAMLWHPRNQRDDAHAWLRNALMRAAVKLR